MTRYANQVVQQIAGVDVPVVGAKVYVYDLSGNLATLTDDAAGPLDNPVTTDEYGNFYYNTDAGVYQHDYWYAGKLRYTDAAVMVGEGLPLPDSILLALSATTGAALLGTASGLTVQQVLDEFELDIILLKGERVSVKDFGAVGNNYSDDTAAIAAAYAYAKLVGGYVYFPPGKYGTTAEINTDGIATTGAGTAVSMVKALAAIRAVFRINGQNNTLEKLHVHGGDLAKAAFIFQASNGSLVRNVIAEFFTVDSVLWSKDGGNNNNSKVQQSLFRHCGTVWYTTALPERGRVKTAITGTATATSGSTVITFTGAPDLTTLGLRPLNDYVYLTGDDRARTIQSITATTITTSAALPFTAPLTGVTFQLISGNVITIENHGDNSAVKVEGCTLQLAPGAAIRSLGLYGVQTKGNQMEVLGYGVHSGITDNSRVTYGMQLLGDYFETFQWKAIYLEQSTNAVVEPAQLNSFADIMVTDVSAKNVGLTISYGGIRLAEGIITYTNSPTVNVDTPYEHHLVYSAAGPHPVINLPDMTTAAKATPGKYSITLRIVALGMGGRVYTLKTTDGSPINGVAGATGVPFVGDHREITLRWNSTTYGWVTAISGQDMAAATPTVGTWARNRRFFYTAPSAAGKIGEVCVTAGTPGTWKPYGAIDA